jgi:hypothetical protein
MNATSAMLEEYCGSVASFGVADFSRGAWPEELNWLSCNDADSDRDGGKNLRWRVFCFYGFFSQIFQPASNFRGARSGEVASQKYFERGDRALAHEQRSVGCQVYASPLAAPGAD